jgi:hypothetical protein
MPVLTIFYEMNSNTRQAIVVVLVIVASIYIETPEKPGVVPGMEQLKMRESPVDYGLSIQNGKSQGSRDSLGPR